MEDANCDCSIAVLFHVTILDRTQVVTVELVRRVSEVIMLRQGIEPVRAAFRGIRKNGTGKLRYQIALIVLLRFLVVLSG